MSYPTPRGGRAATYTPPTSPQHYPHDGPIDHLDGRPVYLITNRRRNRDFASHLVVSFRCGCGGVHVHGWDLSRDPSEPQHRVAHCWTGPLQERGYYIVLEPRQTRGAAGGGE